MSAYRFCRTDDIGLLVDALNRCRAPYVPGEPPMTAAAFKRSIRDLQVWCSSCMNVLNRENVRFTPPGVNGRTGQAFGLFESMIPFVPSAGVLVEF